MRKGVSDSELESLYFKMGVRHDARLKSATDTVRPMELTGGEVRLRSVEPSDVDELYEWWSDPEFAGEYGGLFPKSKPEFEALVKQSEWFIIETPETKEKVGFISYFQPRWDYANLYEIGYRTKPNERGRGYTTEAVRLLVDHMFETMKEIVRIEALTDVDNLPSQRVLEKNGFKREAVMKKRFFANGEYRDDCMYAILREEWQAVRQESKA